MPITDRQAKRAYDRERYAGFRREWIAANGPCQQCGSSKDLEVDHIDPTTKLSHRVWSWSRVRREAELAKCRVLCGSCHQRKTSAEMGAAHRAGKRRPPSMSASRARAAQGERLRGYYLRKHGASA